MEQADAVIQVLIGPRGALDVDLCAKPCGIRPNRHGPDGSRSAHHVNFLTKCRCEGLTVSSRASSATSSQFTDLLKRVILGKQAPPVWFEHQRLHGVPQRCKLEVQFFLFGHETE